MDFVAGLRPVPRENWTDYLIHPADFQKDLSDKEVQVNITRDEEGLDYAGE